MILGNKKRNKKVFIGLSGGVDSSVAAALLKEEGYDVTGVFIKVWSPDWMPCTWPEERRDAMRVAAHLDIPFLTFDFVEEYKKEIVDDLIDGYKRGEVPNPDVLCNKYIKFGAFLNKAKEVGADFIATGHYAQLAKQEFSIFNFQFSKNNSTLHTLHSLLRGHDKNKDQSYFLWTLTQDQLKHCLFPIGEYQKSDVRKLAKKFELPTAEKKDSQGICFVGKVDMKEFLAHYIDIQKGNVVDERGNIIGIHDGVSFYTIGQRHGFTITEKGAMDKPCYIIKKDLEKNTLIGSTKENNLSKTEIKLRDTNWIGDIPSQDTEYEAQIRYRQEPQKCRIEKEEGEIKVAFEKPQNVSAGQSIVVYDSDTCLGGGIVA